MCSILRFPADAVRQHAHIVRHGTDDLSLFIGPEHETDALYFLYFTAFHLCIAACHYDGCIRIEPVHLSYQVTAFLVRMLRDCTGVYKTYVRVP